jgi:hypothetical protein
MRRSASAVAAGLLCVTFLNADSQAVLTQFQGGPAVTSINALTQEQATATRLPNDAAFFAKDGPGDFIYSVNSNSPVAFTATSVATGATTYTTPIPLANTTIGVVLSPVAGTAYVVGNSDESQGLITVIDTKTGAVQTTLTLNPQDSVKAPPQITNNGSTVALLTSSGLAVVNTQTLSVRYVSIGSATQAIALDAAGHAFVLENEAAQIISLGSGAVLKTLTGLPNGSGPLAVTSDGSAFYYVFLQNLIAVETSSGKSTSVPIANVPSGNFPAPTLAMSTDNLTLYYLDPLQGVIATIATASLKVTGSFPAPGIATGMTLGPNSRLDLFTGLPQIFVVDITTGGIESSFPGSWPGGVVDSTGTVYYSYSPESVEAIDLLTKAPAAFGLTGLTQFGELSSNVALGPGDKSLFATGSDSSGVFVAKLVLPSLTTVQEYRLPPAPELGFGSYLSVSGLAVSPDGATLYVPVTVYGDGDARAEYATTAISGIYLFNVASGRIAGVIPDTLPAAIVDFKISPDGLTGYALYSQKGVQTLDLTTGAPLGVYPPPAEFASGTALSLSADGSQLAAVYSYSPGAISVYATKTGLQAGLIVTPAEATAFAFAPDGTTGIAGTTSGFSLVDASSFMVTSSVAIQGGVGGIAIIP